MPAYEITTDPTRFDVDAIHAFLSTSYWSPGIPRATVARAIANSVCFGVLHDGRQVGFARVITDRATFAYLADVYVLEAHRGQGLVHRLIDDSRPSGNVGTAFSLRRFHRVHAGVGLGHALLQSHQWVGAQRKPQGAIGVHCGPVGQGMRHGSAALLERL